MVCINKTWNSCNITREIVDSSWAEETIIESSIYTGLKCYILRYTNNNFTQELAYDTNKNEIVLKIWNKPLVQVGDFLDLSDKSLGGLGRRRIEWVEPKRFKGRLKAIYLYLKKYND